MSIEDHGDRIIAYLPSMDHPDGYRVWCVAHQLFNGSWQIQWRPRAKDESPRRMIVPTRRSAISVIKHSFPGKWTAERVMVEPIPINCVAIGQARVPRPRWVA